MIFIKKGQEPAGLTAYKQQIAAYYEGIPYAEKNRIRQALLIEQGHLCAYCMKRITVTTMTIEHYISQDEDESLALDYNNMLGVCMGNRGNKKDHMTCDAHRGEVKLTVNPLDQASINMIKYKSDGQIYSDNPAIEKDIDESLNLNCDDLGVLLKTNRRNALEVFKNFLLKKKQKGTWSKAFLLSVKNNYLIKQGQNIEYRGILEFYIDKKLR